MSYPVATTRLTRPFEARVPGSKSITNRALIAAALCQEPVVLEGALHSEDTEVAREALAKLGVSVEVEGDTFNVDPRGWTMRVDGGDLYLANAGTAVRFLSAVLCARGVTCRVHGTDRMHERPIGLLIDALSELGGEIRSEADNGCPPLLIGGSGLKGGSASISGQVSSQFFSGLMMAAPFAQTDCTIHVSDEWLSKPYIDLTAAFLKSFGVSTEVGPAAIHIPTGQSYQSPGRYAIEPDATAATYPLALGVLHGVPVTLRGLSLHSLQGDVAFVRVLEAMGCQVDGSGKDLEVQPADQLTSIEMDLNQIPDAAMTVVVLCTLARGRSRLTGLRNLAFKECDRLKALEAELGKMGAKVTADEDGFTIEGVEVSELKGASISTYHDHRMAMCLSLLGTLVEGTVIEDPSCVEKTYPRYFEDLESWVRGAT